MAEEDKLTDAAVEEQPKDSVVVDTSPKPEVTPKETERKPGETDVQYTTRLKTFENQLAGARRITEDTRRELREVRSLIEQNLQRSQQPPAPTSATDGDFWSQVDPRAKEAVEKLVEERAKTLLEQDRQQRQAQDMLVQRQGKLEQSKEKVFSKYPQLHPETGNEDDQFSQLYIQVVNQHPEWHSNEYGPLLALQEAEDLARAQGISLKSAQPALPPNTEVVRRGRVNASAIPPSRTTGDSGKVVLTRDEMEFYERNLKPNGISIETYAKNKRTLEQGGGIEG